MRAERTEEKTLKQKLGDLCGKVILIATAVGLALAIIHSKALAQSQDTTCFVFERLGTELIINACEYGDYRVSVISDGKVVSGGILNHETPCPIFFMEEGYEICIRKDGSNEIVFKGVY